MLISMSTSTLRNKILDTELHISYQTQWDFFLDIISTAGSMPKQKIKTQPADLYHKKSYTCKGMTDEKKYNR